MPTLGEWTRVRFRARIARFRRSLAATLAFAIMLPTIALNTGVALAAVPTSDEDNYVVAEGEVLVVGDEAVFVESDDPGEPSELELRVVDPSGILANDQIDEPAIAELVAGPASASEFELSTTGAFRYIPQDGFSGEDSSSIDRFPQAERGSQRW